MRPERILVGWVLAVILTGALAAADPKPAPTGAAASSEDEEGWPRTRAGELARGWVDAFSTGEAAMRAFLSRELAPKSLAGKNVHQRIERYRDLRERYGKLVFASVVKSTTSELTVKLLDSDMTPHDFVFTVQTAAPYKLVSVGIREMGHGFGGFHH